MESAVWIDGRLTGPGEATLAVDDGGVVTGDGVFETLLAIDHPRRGAFATGRHLARLHRSCAALGLSVPHTDTEIREAIAECTEAAPGAGVVRVTVTSGRGPLGSSRGDGPGSTIVIAGGDRPSWSPATKVAVFPHPRNEHGVMAGVKTSSYAENVVALAYAHERGASEAIFGNIAGDVCEGTGTNIFWVAHQRLHTPPLNSGCLAGVTRELLVERLDVVEANLPIAELGDVEEAFVTSTTRSVQSIAQVDEAKLAVVDGPLTTLAAETMADLIANEIDP